MAQGTRLAPRDLSSPAPDGPSVLSIMRQPKHEQDPIHALIGVRVIASPWLNRGAPRWGRPGQGGGSAASSVADGACQPTIAPCAAIIASAAALNSGK